MTENGLDQGKNRTEVHVWSIDLTCGMGYKTMKRNCDFGLRKHVVSWGHLAFKQETAVEPNRTLGEANMLVSSQGTWGIRWVNHG